MRVYTKQFNNQEGQVKDVITEMTIQFRSVVETLSDLPTSNNVIGDTRVTRDTSHYHVYVNNTWVDQGVFDAKDYIIENLMQELS
mgnify:CR=1 FL=1